MKRLFSLSYATFPRTLLVAAVALLAAASNARAEDTFQLFGSFNQSTANKLTSQILFPTVEADTPYLLDIQPLENGRKGADVRFVLILSGTPDDAFVLAGVGSLARNGDLRVKESFWVTYPFADALWSINGQYTIRVSQ